MLKNIIKKLYLRQNQNLAYFDSLTKTKNRNYFEEEIKQKYNNNQELTLSIIDLDNFKQINDSKGHIYGDKILQILGAILSNNSEIIEVCRFGGDEFVLIHRAELDLLQLDREFYNLTKLHFCFGSAPLK